MSDTEKYYSFSFPGTREDFTDMLAQKSGGRKFLYFEDYLIRFSGSTPEFGIERGGHSGGWWYLPELHEEDGTLYFRGRIKYRDPFTEKKSESYEKKPGEKISNILLYIFALPVILLLLPIIIFDLVKTRFKGKAPTREEKLSALMVNHLHCTQCPDDAVERT